jgi:putative transposon-encoded protein
MELKMRGYEVVEKVAKPCATSARILVPRHWIGKRVRVVRLDP